MGVLELLEAGAEVDAILMDMQMPGMDGLQTARAIRQDNAGRRIPIIAITANFSLQHRKMALEAGMNDFISKPVEAEELKEKLLEVLVSPAEVAARAPSYKEKPSGRTEEGERTEKSIPSLSTLAASPGKARPLLNVSRLDGMRQHNAALLEECLTVYIKQMAAYFVVMERQIAEKDFPAFHEVLHKLLGNAGEAGFYALHQFIYYEVYPEVANQQQWPSEKNWLNTAKTLYTQTVAAIEEHYLTQRPGVTLHQNL